MVCLHWAKPSTTSRLRGKWLVWNYLSVHTDRAPMKYNFIESVSVSTSEKEPLVSVSINDKLGLRPNNEERIGLCWIKHFNNPYMNYLAPTSAHYKNAFNCTNNFNLSTDKWNAITAKSQLFTGSNWKIEIIHVFLFLKLSRICQISQVLKMPVAKRSYL